MTLLHPAALWLLALVAVLLLLSRRRTARPRRQVGNIYQWSQLAASRQARWSFSRLRRHWLLLLQAAVLVALIAALAGPMVSWRVTPAAVIVDISSSMSARDESATRLDLARRAAKSAVAAMPARTRVHLIAAGYAPLDLGEFQAADPALGLAIERIEASAGPSDLVAAVALARAGGQAPALTIVSDRHDPDSGAIDAQWIVVGRPADNVAITSLSARRLPAAPSDGQVIATIQNFGASVVDTELEIFDGARVIARRPLHIGGRSSVTVAADAANLGGIVRARVDAGDALAADNQRTAVVAERERLTVRLISPGQFFLEQALRTNPHVTLERGDDPGGETRADVVVCDRCDGIPGGDAGVLMLTAPAAGTRAPLTIALPQHPVAARLDVSGLSASAGGRHGVPDGGDIILRAGASPAIVSYEHDGRRVVAMRLPVDESGIALAAAFPVLLDNILNWLDSRAGNPTELMPGQPLRWTVPGRAAATTTVLLGPDGRPRSHNVNGRIVTSSDTAATGIYEIHHDGWLRRFAVNAAVEGESDLSGLDDERTSSAAQQLPAEGPSAQADAAPWLLVLALVLLATEWHLRLARVRTG